MTKILENSTFATFYPIWETVNPIIGKCGVIISCMVHYTPVIFSQEDVMRIFGVAVFDPGNDERTFPYPYCGSVCCKGKYGNFNPFPFVYPLLGVQNIRILW